MNFNKQMAIPISPKIKDNFFVHWFTLECKKRKSINLELMLIEKT